MIHYIKGPLIWGLYGRYGQYCNIDYSIAICYIFINFINLNFVSLKT